MEKGAFNPTFMTGAPFTKWLDERRSHAPHADDRSRLPGRQVSRGAPAQPCRGGPAAWQRHAAPPRTYIRTRRLHGARRCIRRRDAHAALPPTGRGGGRGDPARHRHRGHRREPPPRRRLDQRRPRLGLLPVLHRPDHRRSPALGILYQALLGKKREHRGLRRLGAAEARAVGAAAGGGLRAGDPLPRHLRRLGDLHRAVHDRPGQVPAGARASIAALAVNAVFFFMFEVWFKVPLFKGRSIRWASSATDPAPRSQRSRREWKKSAP